MHADAKVARCGAPDRLVNHRRGCPYAGGHAARSGWRGRVRTERWCGVELVQWTGERGEASACVRCSGRGAGKEGRGAAGGRLRASWAWAAMASGPVGLPRPKKRKKDFSIFIFNRIFTQQLQTNLNKKRGFSEKGPKIKVAQNYILYNFA